MRWLNGSTRRVKRSKILLPKLLLFFLVVLVLVVSLRFCSKGEPMEESPQFRTSFEMTPPPDADNSDAALVAAVLNADPETGMKIENNVSYSDLLNLSRIMAAESGPNWPEWAVMAIGEVVLNRVASPEFPNTISEVLAQPNQYEPVLKNSWVDIRPDERTVWLAFELLNGERVLNDPSVVFQALFEQGSSVAVEYIDEDLGTTTYFCRSNYPELYE